MESLSSIVMCCRGKPKNTILVGVTSFLLSFEYKNYGCIDKSITITEEHVRGYKVQLLNALMNPVFNSQPIIIPNKFVDNHKKDIDID